MNDEHARAPAAFIVHRSSFIVCHLESAPVKRFVLAVLVTLVACGKRGDPRPPVPIIPKATSDLVVTQRGSKVILTWSYPSLSTAGQTLHDLRRVVVYRVTEELSVPPAGRDPNAILPGDTDPTVPPPIAQFAKVPPLTVTQFLKLREKVDSIEGANLPAATTGAHLVYEDTPQTHTRDGRPVRLTYTVVSEGSAAKSDLSNLAPIVPLDVPPPPADLGATPKQEGVVLTWTPTGSAKLFNIYRSGVNDAPDELAPPVNAAPVKGTTYTDVPPYGTYKYRVTAVASPGPPRVESEPSAPVTATFKDLVAPPAPATLTTLVETKTVRLIWDPVDASDLAGYYVYRYQGNARIKFQTAGPIPSTHFGDDSTEPGIEYVYAVTAVDKNGNESPERRSEPVLVPKTP
jgi:fibronectin type 3 domain-containing protein